MTLDEVIKRFSNNAEYERTHGSLQGCLEFRQLAEWLTELKELKEQTEPCDDCVSRQAAIDALRDAENHAFNSLYKGLVWAHKIIADLPSVKPEHKTGRWIEKYHETFKYYCNICNSGSDLKTKFCPHCGAKMEEGE